MSMDMLLRMQAWHDASQMRARAGEIDVQRYEPARPDQEAVRRETRDHQNGTELHSSECARRSDRHAGGETLRYLDYH